MGASTNEVEVSLVRRAREGDSNAYSELVRLHGLRAYRVAFSLLRDHPEAEDVVQEAFVTAYRNLARLKDTSLFWPWLARIVGNKARDLLRRQSAERRALKRVDRQLPAVSPGESDERAALWAAVWSLDEPHRMVVLLHYSGELSTVEVAAVLDRPVGTIRRWLAEAYKHLRGKIGKDVAL
jgi:RNA polymerase sigma factor (sigma-70 family)